MAASYGFDISGPARTRQGGGAVALLRLPGRREGAERRRDVARPDVDVPRHLLRTGPRRGRAHRGAGAGDHRRLRHQAAHRPLPAHAGVRRAVRRRSDLGDGVDRRHGRRRPVAGDQDELPLSADALQPRSGAGAESDDLVLAAAARRRSGASPPRSPSTPARSSSRATRSCAARGATTGRSRAACRRCWSASRCSSSAPAPTSPSACSTPSTAGGTKSAANRSARRSSRCRATYLEFDDVLEKFERMMDWLAGVYVNAMNIIHYMHDKYAYERIEMALHDYAPLRTMAFGMAGMSVVADSLSAIKHAKVRVIRDETGLVTDYETEGDVPGLRQQRQPRRSARRRGLVSTFMSKLRKYPTYRNALHTQSILTITSNVVYGKATGNTPDGRRQGRAVCARRESDARPRQPRHPRRGGVGGEDSLSRRRGRHLADGHAGAGRASAGSPRIASRISRRSSMRSSAAPAIT